MLDDCWHTMIAFDRELIEDHGWNQRPILEFVSWLSVNEVCRDLFSGRSTSYEWLE